MFLFHLVIPSLFKLFAIFRVDEIFGEDQHTRSLLSLFNPVKTPPLWTKPPCLWCLWNSGGGTGAELLPLGVWILQTKPWDIVLNAENKAEPWEGTLLCGVNLGSSQILDGWTEILFWNIAVEMLHFYTPHSGGFLSQNSTSQMFDKSRDAVSAHRWGSSKMHFFFSWSP